MKTRKIILTFLLATILICNFSGCNVRDDEPKANSSVILLSGILESYVPSQTPNFSQITGGANASCNIDEIMLILQSDSIELSRSEFQSVGYDYEMVLVAEEDEYFSVVRGNGTLENVPILMAFAYSYESKEVYYFHNNECYIVKNADSLREKIGIAFAENGVYSDTKFFWKKADALKKYPVPGKEESIVSYNFSFRYTRFWCIDQLHQENDFLTLEGYSANDMKSMILNLSNCLGYPEFEAVLANDVITGYWRLEFYDLESEKYALIYVDNEYQILFGTQN